MINFLLRKLGHAVAHYLSKPLRGYAPVATISPELLASTLLPGDVLLVEGNSRLSTAIKYLTQSTWSHAAFYVGSSASKLIGNELPMLVEVDLVAGVRLVPLTTYEHLHTRVCRPQAVTSDDLERMISAALARIGQQYDLKNIFDLARYFLPIPLVPTRWRRRLIALGSGDPTKAICSSFIAQLFQGIRYPILPEVHHVPADHPGRSTQLREIMHIRNCSLYAPRDFDISPYFLIIKPECPTNFDYRTLRWDG